MDNTFHNSIDVPELDMDTANQLLSNVFSECSVTPNTIPLEVLETWGNYKKTEFRFGRIVSYVFLVILVLLPLAFFQPTFVAQRTNVDSTALAVYRIQLKTLFPASGVSATLNGVPVALQKESGKNYLASVPDNGTLVITATGINGQKAIKKYEVAFIDKEPPRLVKSYTEDGKVYLVVRDTYSGVDYTSVQGATDDGSTIAPVVVDKDTELIAFTIPDVPIKVSISDTAGNVLQILLSPTK